jgi:predicted protein tyrosine phosphatase
MSLSDQIRQCRQGVVNNPYQGSDKRVLFVCSMGILRSATAARIYGNRYNTRSAGSWHDALIPLSNNLLSWADEIVFVNRHNYEQVQKYMRDENMDLDSNFNVKVLDIPDMYPHMHQELIKAFHEQYEPVDNIEQYEKMDV